MVPPPDWPHEDFDARLNKSLILFVASNGDPGEVYHPQAAIYTDDTYLEPDMMYVSNELAARMGKRRTSADIVFEYTSKSSATYDYTTKADTYLALGVKELWLVDSDNEWIEVRYRVDRDASPAPGGSTVPAALRGARPPTSACIAWPCRPSVPSGSMREASTVTGMVPRPKPIESGPETRRSWRARTAWRNRPN